MNQKIAGKGKCKEKMKLDDMLQTGRWAVWFTLSLGGGVVFELDLNNETESQPTKNWGE